MYWIRLDPRCARPFRRKGYSGGIKAKPKRRRRQRVAIPEDLRQDVTQIAQSIARKYRHAFEADCELKTCILTLMSALLPPFPIGPGRPGNPMVTLALKLRAEFRRQFPEETWSQICQRVYVAVIPGYTNMGPMQQREDREWLHERMNWRRRAKRKRRRRQRVAIPKGLRADVTSHARAIRRKYRRLFEADRELKARILTLMRALLPPFPIGPGRPGNPMVTLALKLRAKFRRQFPEETWSQICQRVYVAVIPGYTNLPPMEQRDARRRLLERMTWRRRKRYPRKNRAEFAVS